MEQGIFHAGLVDCPCCEEWPCATMNLPENAREEEIWMKRWSKGFVLAMVLALGLSGCGSQTAGTKEAPGTAETPETVASNEGAESTESAAEDNSGESKEEVVLSLLIDNNVSLDGLTAVCDLAKEKLGITVEIEYKVDDSVLKTRLASGEMTDLLVYNSGSLLDALNPSEYFMDLTDQPFVDLYDEVYKDSVTVEGVVYGVPFASTQAGAVMYYKPVYEELGLEIPHTWDQFIANCEAVKEAGYTAYISSTAKKSMTQVLFLGDHYNVVSESPDFVSEFEKGNKKYAEEPAALKSWEKYEDMWPFLQEGHTATTYDEACDMLAQGQGVHWICLTQALSNIYSLYGEEAVNNIGVFGIPGDDPEDHGLTVWMPNSLYGSLNSDKQEDILRFMEFYVSDEALNAYAEAILPDGPYCITGYSLPENSYDAVKNDMQEYFDSGRTKVAMEFQTAVKGANCATITQALISELSTGAEAAAEYDEDCKLQAIQLGLDWN